MIILRQKAFTRAEKEAIKQIWRKTNGLRQLPNGITNVEDAKALKDLSNKLNKGGKKIVITPEIQTALNNMGLTKVTPELLNRVNQKYRNPELMKRFVRIKSAKNQGQPDFSKYTERDIQTGRHISESTAEDLQKVLNRSKRHFRSKTPESNGVIRFYRKKKGSVLDVQNPAAAFSVNKIREGGTTGLDSQVVNQYAKLSKDRNNIKELNRYIENPNGELIGVSKKKSPLAIVMHEVGHNKSSREIKTIPIKNPQKINNTYNYGGILQGLGTVAEENMASANAIHLLRNQPNLKKNKAILDNAINSYIISNKAGTILPSKYTLGIPIKQI